MGHASLQELLFTLKQKGTEMSNQSPLNAQLLSGKSGAETTVPTKDKTPSKTETDPRLDPRIKKFFAAMPAPVEKPNVSSREELLAQENSPAALAALERQTALFDSMDSEEIASSAGWSVHVETLTSSPDGNTIKIRYVRPDNSEILPCVYYIHGGRMEMSSCFEGNYRTWARMIAARGCRGGHG
jgi:acetyl esterase